MVAVLSVLLITIDSYSGSNRIHDKSVAGAVPTAVTRAVAVILAAIRN